MNVLLAFLVGIALGTHQAEAIRQVIPLLDPTDPPEEL